MSSLKLTKYDFRTDEEYEQYKQNMKEEEEMEMSTEGYENDEDGTPDPGPAIEEEDEMEPAWKRDRGSR